MPSADKPFVINGRVRIINNKIHYIPGLAELLKWAWIQYFSIMVLVAAFVLPFLTFAMKQRIFATYLNVDRMPTTHGPSYMPLATHEPGVKISGKTFMQYNF